jgi:hypothetical protein
MIEMNYTEEQLRMNVETAGGVWVGIQTAIPPKPSVVEFFSPSTDHAMFLPVDQCSVDAVTRKLIVDSENHRVNMVRIPRYKLCLFIDKIKDMEEFITMLLEEKK